MVIRHYTVIGTKWDIYDLDTLPNTRHKLSIVWNTLSGLFKWEMHDIPTPSKIVYDDLNEALWNSLRL